MEGQQLLRDPSVEPTGDAIAAALGSANSAYLRFVGEIEDHAIEVDWRYYKDGKAWLGKALYKWTTSRGTQKETTTCWLSVWDGFFRVGFTFPEKYRADVLRLPLGQETKRRIEAAGQMGKLKLFPLGFDVRSDDLLDEMYTLVEFKKTIK